MSGVAGRSGRKPGQATGAYEETLTRRRVPLNPSENERVRALVVTRLRDHDRYDLKAFIHQAFSVEQVTGIQVERILINSEHMKVGVMTRSILEEHDPEVWCITTYHGPGKFCFKPTVDGVWMGPMKTLRLGTVDSSPDLDDQVDVDGSLARVMNRESKIATLRQLRSLNDPTHPVAQGDEMKLGEVVEILKLVGVAREQGGSGTSEIALVREELRTMRESLAARPNMLGSLEPFIPLLTPMMGGVSKGLIAQIVRAFIPQPAAPPAQVIEPAPSIMDSIRSILEQPHIAAMLQPLIVVAMQKLQQTSAIPTTAVPSATIDPSLLPPGGAPVATFQTTDPDLIEAINYIVLAIGERKFPEAYAMFRSFPEQLGMPFVSPITPAVDPFPFMLRLRTLDARLRSMGDNLRDFVMHIQTQIELMLAAREAEEREEANEDPADHTPPATRRRPSPPSA